MLAETDIVRRLVFSAPVPLALLAGMSASNIIAAVDLTGLSAGDHTVEVEVTAPSGLIPILISPSEVIVNLTSQ